MKKCIYLSIILLSFSCRNKSTTEEVTPAPDPIPEEQEIVYQDTSGLTGELTVLAKYYDANNQIHDAPEGTHISLFASTDDLINDLSLYDVWTTGDSAYFGFINYGNYYIKSDLYIDTLYYYNEAALQIRPDRKEKLIVTMY